MRRRVHFNKGLINYTDRPDMIAMLFDMDNNRMVREREKYQKDVQRFAYSLKQLKYALKTIHNLFGCPIPPFHH